MILIKQQSSLDVLGIDFGTTNSVVCMQYDGKLDYFVVKSPVCEVPLKTLMHVDKMTQFFNSLRIMANKRWNKNLHNCILSTPVHFDEKHKQALVEAGNNASLKVVRIIPEPVAAALACDITTPGIYGVYDLGAGTCDFSILKIIDSNTTQVLGSAGMDQVGGYYWDLALEKASGVEASIITDLRETGKNNLIENFDKYLEEECSPILQKTILECKRLIKELKVKPKQIICIGGMANMKMVPEALRALGPVIMPKNGQTCVACGLAKYGADLYAKNVQLLLDAAALSVGVVTSNDLVEWVIKKNTPLPCQESVIFTNQDKNQTHIEFNIVQGTVPLVEKCRLLGQFAIKIPKNPPHSVQIELSLTLDNSGMLIAKATNLSSGESAVLEMNSSVSNEIKLELSHEYSPEIDKEKTLRALFSELDLLLSAIGNPKKEIELRKSITQIDDAEKLKSHIHKKFKARLGSDLMKAAQRVYDEMD